MLAVSLPAYGAAVALHLMPINLAACPLLDVLLAPVIFRNRHPLTGNAPLLVNL